MLEATAPQGSTLDESPPDEPPPDDPTLDSALDEPPPDPALDEPPVDDAAYRAMGADAGAFRLAS